MRVELTDRAMQVIRQLKPSQRDEVLALINRASSQDSDRFFQANKKYKLANPLGQVAYIRGPNNLRIVLSITPDGKILIEDVLAKEVLSKITGKKIQ